MVKVSIWPKGFFRLCYLYNILKCLQTPVCKSMAELDEIPRVQRPFSPLFLLIFLIYLARALAILCKLVQTQKSEFQCFLHKIKLLTSLDINFGKDHRDKTEVPEPLALEDLISCKLNNKWKLARLITHLNFPLWPRPMKLTA